MAQATHSLDLVQPSPCNLQQAFSIHNDEIRVVDILPGSGSDDISLNCRVISLRSGDSFEALSYVWGDVTTKRIIKISGYTFEVTHILYTALQQLRQAQNKRTLWVDQICINQNDDDEKSQQVGLMRTIYKSCSQCLIWLGPIPADERFSEMDAEVALDFIQATAENRPATNVWVDSDTHTFFVDNECGERARRAFKALIMGGNPWWSRVWTLQEASLPFAATLHWGPLTIPLETIELAAKSMCAGWIWCAPSSAKVANEYRELVSYFLYPVRGLSIARAGDTPLNTLMRWRYRKATDPRDKVYGFAGLFRADTLSSIHSLRDISYTISPAILFTRVTLDLIRFDQDLLPLVGARELPHVTPGLPTWAIDFASSCDIGQRQSQWWQHFHRYNRWVTSKGMRPQFEASSDERTLYLSGELIDEVHTVSEVYHVAPEEDVIDDQVQETILQRYRLLERYELSHSRDFSADYFGGGTLKDAFWRTMLGNLIMEEKPRGVPKDYDITDFEDYVNDGRHNRLTLSLHGLVPNHAFFITSKGYIGIGPADMREGDHVCVFAGGRTPFVVRSVDIPTSANSGATSGRYFLVGDAYMHGIMRGEAVQCEERHPKTIMLV
jgi:hypothetical protein